MLSDMTLCYKTDIHVTLVIENTEAAVGTRRGREACCYSRSSLEANVLSAYELSNDGG